MKCPFAVKEKKPTLYRLTEKRNITNKTKIEMVEYDLYNFRAKENEKGWGDMAHYWLERGASLDIFCQTIHPLAQTNIRKLQTNFSNLKVYEMNKDSELSEGRLILPSIICATKTSHYALFLNPTLRWQEEKHEPESDLLQNCMFTYGESSRFDPQFIRLKNQVKKIRENSVLI